MARSPREDKSQKRTAIADAALHVIGTKGIAELTMANLAAELGVTSGALFRHFTSRDEILEEVAQRVAELVGATLPAETLPPMERIRALFLNRTAVLGREAGIARLVFSDQFTKALPPAAAALIHGVVRQTRAFLLKALRDAAVGGLIRRDIPAEELLLPVLGTLQHLGFLTALNPEGMGFSRPDPERVLATLSTLLKPAPVAA